jgi:hypothetical protein
LIAAQLAIGNVARRRASACAFECAFDIPGTEAAVFAVVAAYRLARITPDPSVTFRPVKPRLMVPRSKRRVPLASNITKPLFALLILVRRRMSIAMTHVSDVLWTARPDEFETLVGTV